VAGNGTLNTSAIKYIKTLDTTKGTILGGHALINDSIANSIKQSGITNIERIYGANRYETCIRICEKYSQLFKENSVSIATGLDFPDALAGGVFAAKNNLPIILVDNNSSKTVINNYIQSKNIEIIYVFGGKGAVSDVTIENMISTKN
jgi:putative cell wall-binding protein